MEKRYNATMNQNILEAIESASGTKVSEESMNLINKGASEKDLVYSGLEETMITAYNNIRNRMVNTKGIKDLRTAAFVEAIDKVAISYTNLGIWP
jgi:glutamate dehydrogenase (NAD(P)+)